MRLMRSLILLAALVAAPAFATQTVMLAPAQTAATSSATACTSTCTISLNTATAPNPVDIEVDLISNSVPQKIGDLTPWPAHPILVVQGGSYQVIRKDISAYGQNAGVTIDVPAGSGGGGSVTQGTTPWVVDGTGGTFPVTGTFWQATQPISATSLPLPSNAAQETGGNLATLAGAVSSGKVNIATAAYTSTQAGSTVTTHLTFQSALASSASRRGCLLLNTSSDKMWVYFGATGSATTSNSIPLSAGQTVSCGVPGGVLTDNVAVTSNAVDGATYVVVSQ